MFQSAPNKLMWVGNTRSSAAASLSGWTTWTRSKWSTWFTQSGPKGSREWTTRTMRCGLGLPHTWLCRDKRGEFLA
jgi:hypothetical protein